MGERAPADPAEHAEEFAHRWRDKLEEYCTVRMQELGIPDHMNGEPDYDGDGKWHAFDPAGRQGGGCVTGVVVDSGVRNPELLKGKKGGRIYPKLRCATASIQPSPTSMRSCEPAPTMRRSRQQQRRGCRSRRVQGGFVRRWRDGAEAVGRLPRIALFPQWLRTGCDGELRTFCLAHLLPLPCNPSECCCFAGPQPGGHPASLARAKSSAFRSNPFLVSRQIEFRPSRKV